MKEQKNLGKIRDFFRSKKRMPSYSELAKIVGFKSKNAVHKLVERLCGERLIEKDRSGRLLPGALFYSLKMLGTVEAGFPSPAEEELADTMSLDDFLIENKEATYMLTVKGDSMKDAGIMNGDIALVERKTDAKDGTIVVAEIDGDFTIKYLRKSAGKIWLEPANSEFKNLYPKESLKISAIVTAVIRKY